MNKRRPDTDLIVKLTLILTEKYIGCSSSNKVHESPYNFTSLYIYKQYKHLIIINIILAIYSILISDWLKTVPIRVRVHWIQNLEFG
jgi:hypothetical protein